MKRLTKWDAIIMTVLVIIALAARIPAARLEAAPEEMRSLYTTEEGLPYLADMDSYYYYRIVEQYVETGVINGEIDELRGIGETETSIRPLLIYVTASAYRVLNALFGVTLYAVAYWICATLGALTVIPVYLFIRRLCGRAGAVTAVVAAAFSARFVSQTLPGVLDTDAFNILLPLLTILFFTAAMRARKPLTAMIYTAASIGTYYLFTQNWVFAVYMLIFMALFVLIYVPLSFFLRGNDAGGERKRLGGLLSPVALTVGMAVISWKTLLSTVQDLFGNIQGAISPLDGSFPVYTMVISEMQKGTLLSGNPFLSGEGGIVNALGGIQCVIMAVIGLGVMARRAGIRCTQDRLERRGRVSDLLSLLLLSLIYMVATYAGYRFVMLLALPVGLFAGVGVDALVGLAGRRIHRRSWRRALGAVACAAICATPLAGAVQSGFSRLPQANAEMDEAMTYMRENTDENAALVSWWDNGYYYEYGSQRRTLYDGGRNWSDQMYYTSCALTTEDEDLAANIITMMAVTETKAHTLLSEMTGSHKEAARILLSILSVGKDEAATLLTDTEGFTAEEAAEILVLSHPTPEGPVYFLYSSDMLGKAGWYYFFAGWDFESAGGDESVASIFVSQTAAQLTAGQRTEFYMGNSDNGEAIYAVVNVSSDGQMNVTMESRDNGVTTDCTDILSRVIVTDAQGMAAELLTGSGNYTLALFMDGDVVRPALLSNEMANCWYLRRLMGDESGARFTRVYEDAVDGSLVNRLMTLDTSRTQAGAFTIWRVNEE